MPFDHGKTPDRDTPSHGSLYSESRWSVKRLIAISPCVTLTFLEKHGYVLRESGCEIPTSVPDSTTKTETLTS